MFSSLPKIFYCSATFILSSANAINMDQSEILSFDRDLLHMISHNSSYNYGSIKFFLFFQVTSLIIPFPNKPCFLRVCSTSLLKILWEKVKLLVTSNFTFSHSVFCPFGELSAIFIKLKIVVCKLFQFGIV